MLANLVTETSGVENLLYWIEWVSLIIEAIAVLIIVVAIIIALARYVYGMLFHPKAMNYYQRLKISLGKALLLGLEILVAADIIRTVALEATPSSVLVLGMLVLIRTFLSWALVVEMEGHWPWRQPLEKPEGAQ